MASRSIFRAAVAAALLSASPILVPAFTGQIAPAAAAVNVSINFNTFYDGMSNYGDWVSYRGAYVWVPTSVGPSWRPYTLGHWVWTTDNGWLWVSDEPFGWAAYHYGRWGYSNDFGWYWVPGRRWAPAWVSWRNADNIVGWAPLPPESDETMVNIDVNSLPDYYWNVVPTRSFMSPRISVSLVFDVGQRRQFFQGGRPGGNVIIRNNVVVNNFIDVNFISKQTGQQIRPVRLVKSDKPGNAMLQGDQLVAFTGDVQRDTNIKPVKIVDVAKVKVTVKDRVKRDKPVKEIGLPDNGQNAGGNDQTGTDKKLGKPNKKTGTDQGNQNGGTNQSGPTGGPDNGTATDQTKIKKNKKKLPPDAMQQNGAGSDQTQSGGTNQPGTMDQTQPGLKKNKKKLGLPAGTDTTGQGTGTGQVQSGGSGQPGTMDQTQPGLKKNKKKLGQPGSSDTMNGQGMNSDQTQPADNGMPKKKNKKNGADIFQQNGGTDQGGQMPGANGQNQKQQKLKKQPPAGKPAKCDPQTDPTCPPTLN